MAGYAGCCQNDGILADMKSAPEELLLHRDPVHLVFCTLQGMPLLSAHR